jgi:uncharacterized protein (DUF697 family)
LVQTASELEPAVPVLWLLGKTGAGKTSLVRALTGAGAVGNGYAPGTRQSTLYDFPVNAPAVRFLDTRGVGEAGHDPGGDLKAAATMAQAALAVIRLDDPVQEPLAQVLKGLKLPVLLVFTGADLIANVSEQERARARMRRLIGRDLPFVTVSMPDDGLISGIDDLLAALDSFMPHAVKSLRRAAEARAFARLRPLVRRYAAMAGGGDVVPLAGTLAVPAAQAMMLRTLAHEYGLELTPARWGLLTSALGTGALVRMGLGHLLRQGAKLVPGAGQTLGAAAAAGTSFATTYALGRAACFWLYGEAHGAPADPVTLRSVYAQALRGARDAAG